MLVCLYDADNSQIKHKKWAFQTKRLKNDDKTSQKTLTLMLFKTYCSENKKTSHMLEEIFIEHVFDKGLHPQFLHLQKTQFFKWARCEEKFH